MFDPNIKIGHSVNLWISENNPSGMVKEKKSKNISEAAPVMVLPEESTNIAASSAVNGH